MSTRSSHYKELDTISSLLPHIIKVDPEYRCKLIDVMFEWTCHIFNHFCGNHGVSVNNRGPARVRFERFLTDLDVINKELVRLYREKEVEK